MRPLGNDRSCSLFRSFWIAGFECSCHINSKGERLDMSCAVQHDSSASEDYGILAQAGIRTARDGLRWHRIERGGAYDFSSWTPMLKAAREQDVQVIWDLCHYGWPDDLDIFAPAFVERFARYCRMAACVHREHNDAVPFYAPINEISFFSWAACRDLMFPHARGRDAELKRQLVRAAIAAAEAVWSVDPRARLVYPEPLIHNVPPRRNPRKTGPAQVQRESQFEAWDMLCGRAAPELGGHPRYLDVMGVNFYAANEWEVPGGRKLRWDARPRDSRWMPLHRLLEEVYTRYERPLFIAETSHYGTGRAAWIKEVARECVHARQCGVPLEGICLYPILDRHDWEDPSHWHNSGLWDLVRQPDGRFERQLNWEYAKALESARELLAQGGCY